jgi:hypothetical protein
MANPIIAAVRPLPFKESVSHTLIELAHRASIYGVVKVSYAYMAMKCHCSRRTIIRHIQRLIEAKIIEKSVMWIKGNFCEINTYTFRISWQKSESKGGSDKMTSKFPPPEEGEKEGGLREKIHRQETWLLTRSGLTPGSFLYELEVEKIAKWRTLLGGN